MAQLAGKVALVTGAARGIGQSIALKLAAEGADVAVCDLEKDWLAETTGKVAALGRKAHGYAANVSQADDVNNTVTQIHKDFGHIDILVNNAGITKDNLLIRMSDEEWDQVLAVNLKGTFLFTRAVGKIMMKQRAGSMVNIASIIGLIGNAGQINYAASKAGVIALTRSVARELASRNVRANAVAPGFIQTKMTDKLPEDVRARMLGAIPLARFGQPDDVADAVLFLAGDASRYITGQVLSICGGMVMQ
jgi:3-oxoacyl-[acyl-carrier protein] reductase